MRHARRAPGVRLQAVHPWRFLEITHVCVFSIVPVITARTLRRSLAARRPVKMITDVVALELRSSALRRTAASRRRAASSPSAAAAASCRRLETVLLAAAAVLPAAESQLKSIPLFYEVGPPFSHLSVGEGRLSRHRLAGRLPEDRVHELRHDPVTK